MLKNLCDAIKGIDDLIKVEVEGDGSISFTDEMLNVYCPRNIRGQHRKNEIKGEKGQCFGYAESTISAFITLLETFKSDGYEENLEENKLAQYAILLLSYKMNQNHNISAGINNIYNMFHTNDYWNTNYNNYIEQIKKLMDIKDVSKFYNLLKLLCDIYTELDDEATNCTNCLEEAKKFAEKYNELIEDSNNTEGSSYRKMLSALSTDYNCFKKKCNDNGCNDIPSLLSIHPTKKYVEFSVDISEATSSSSSIAGRLIPILSIFVAISLFLGIAYKYSLFGFDKRIHRQYLREKLKKIKKKMNHYI
ncbi:Plasmodium variant antigen protein Cir/Yir/Bir, putative [Plasmodium chabaudi adami]|uniref:Plasmodium variant antigen protein Cir/Yir/Bir, putative n=1 Tax=Plasmodium chabaudi adami TaxID=5826 RepID=A0A1C6X0E2_PLACE|nr:Plasmodium variant antigen protein Cir/Yir/Bir, putative [Plasmodium chabaudi adami]